MLGGAYSSQYKNLERQQVDTLKTLAENEKVDAIARAKKLSLETNKRRRALAIKRKAESEREERRRQQILAKRREQQNEATQRFQRAHMPARPVSGNSGKWSPQHRTTSQLDDALKLVRGSPRASSARTRSSPNQSPPYYRQNTDPLSKPYFNKYAHPTVNQQNGNRDKREELHNKSLRNLNNSRTLFEQQLETYQQSLAEQQQKALKDFNKQVMKEIELDKNVAVAEDYMNRRDTLERSESLSTVDSLEDNNSNDTLRESCELDSFMGKQNDPSNGNSRTVTFAEPARADSYNGVQNGGNIRHKTIDSFNTQTEQMQTGSQYFASEQKQQFILQRQQEIQQQLQEQQQQQQQQDLKQKVLNQQLQQQIQQQQEKHQTQVQHTDGQDNNNGHLVGRDDEKENFRPKAQMKAWATPSPHPPPQVSAVTAQQNLVTNSSPYTGKNTITNTTVTTYDRMPANNYGAIHNNGNGNGFGNGNGVVKPGATNGSQHQNNNNSSAVSGKAADALLEYNQCNTTKSDMSFLESVTNGLSRTPHVEPKVTMVTTTSAPAKVPPSSVNGTAAIKPPPAPTQPTTATKSQPSTVGSTTMTTNKTSITSPKPPGSGYYISSYGAAFVARQVAIESQKQKQQTIPEGQTTVNTVTMTTDSSALNGHVPRGTFGLSNGQLVTYNGDDGQDITDTDSVSTICEEKEPEPKEIKSILKRNNNGGTKKGSILKKSGSTGNIRDSLEITRVHLQTSAEEKEQRPNKKNVRFADLCYDDEPAQNEEDKLFVKRNEDTVTLKPPRPASAVSTKTTSQKVDNKPPRAASASTVRTSSIPRAKTQVVRPQATAHIIQSSQSSPSEQDKKVMIVNSNFMEKVPAMARANQIPSTVSPSAVYAVSSVNPSRPVDQKGNYAVSSIVMPKGESAPFIYPSYPGKQGIQPTAGGSSVPLHTASGNAYDSNVVYDENGLRIDRTPTDDEINFLWDKVRSCLSRNSQATPDGNQVNGQDAHRQAAPVANTYIDGNALGQFNSLNRVAQSPSYNPPGGGVRRQTSLDSMNSSYSRRNVLLQQRKQQMNPNSLKGRPTPGPGQQGYTVYQAPVQSQMEPQSPAGPHGNQEVSESLAGFLAAEQLAEQSVSESRIHQAMEEAQMRQQAYNSARPQPKVKSALSIEEQKLLESLDRLNDKLKMTDAQIPNNNTVPPFVHQKQQQQLQQQQQQQQHLHNKQQHVVHRY